MAHDMSHVTKCDKIINLSKHNICDMLNDNWHVTYDKKGQDPKQTQKSAQTQQNSRKL